MDKEIMIKVENVSKTYQLGTIDRHSFVNDLFRNSDRKYIQALDDVSFEIEKGETVGLIGANGAGKSTLLKILSRVTTPTQGKVYLDGTLSSMLEVGTGFHQELSGRENIYINGTILGMTKKEIDRKLDDIIEFSECREFIDTPVKRYSSGMYVKLAFSVAAYLESDIMILDEVLAVGDAKFQNKCLEKIRELSSAEGRTILCVSHNMATINKLCKRCLVMDHGKLIFDGDTQEATRSYYGESKETETEKDYSACRRFLWLQRDDVRLLKANYIEKEDAVFWDQESIKMHFEWIYHADVVRLGIRFEISDQLENTVATAVLYEFASGDCNEKDTVDLEIDISSLREGKYTTIYTFFALDSSGESVDLDCIEGLRFEKCCNMNKKMNWHSKAWGSIELPEMRIIKG